MADTVYTYSISTDTANGKADSERLHKEIDASNILVALRKITTAGDNFNVTFKDSLDSIDEGLLDALIAVHEGEPLSDESLTNPDGVQLVDIVFPKGSPGSKAKTIVSHEFSQRSTWYQQSVRVTDEVLTEDSSGLTFSAINAHWIDIHHACLTLRHNYIHKRDGTLGAFSEWEVVVKIDDVVQTSGYTVDYESGTITFDSDQSGNTVKATYSHNDGVANRSEFMVKPTPGKIMIIEHVECQFSTSTIMNSPFRFEIWAGNTVEFFEGVGWDTSVFDAGYGQYRIDYKNFLDFINMGNLGTGAIPQLAGHSSEICVFPFNYVKSLELKSSNLPVVRIVIMDDSPTTSSDISTVTFYVEEVDE